MKPLHLTPPKAHLDSLAQVTAQVKKDKESHQRRARVTTLADGSIAGHGATAVPVKDGWTNFITGLGTTKDKRKFNAALWQLALAEEQAEELYAADATARRIVDLLPNEALREGIDWDDEAAGQPWDEDMERLQVFPKFNTAWSDARLYGGAGLFMNDGVTKMEELWRPLDRLNQLESLVPLTRWELQAYATDLQKDISKPNFGTPNLYQLYPRMTFGQTGTKVHASRIIRFDGKRLPRLLFIRNNFWGDSVLTALTDVLGDYKASSSSVATVLHDFRLLVHKMKGLTDAVHGGKESEVKTRLEIMALAQSVMGAYAIDAEDDMQFHSSSLAGVADLVDRVKQRLQAETDIPHTILFNEGPGGALAGGQAGKSEERMWYNTVHSERMKYLKPRLNQLFKVMAMQAKAKLPKGDNEGAPDYTFGALWQMDEKDQASMEKDHAMADQLYLDMGVRTAAAIQLQRFPTEAKDKAADASFVEAPDPNATPLGPDGKPLTPSPEAAGAAPAKGAPPKPKGKDENAQ